MLGLRNDFQGLPIRTFSFFYKVCRWSIAWRAASRGRYFIIFMAFTYPQWLGEYLRAAVPNSDSPENIKEVFVIDSFI